MKLGIALFIMLVSWIVIAELWRGKVEWANQRPVLIYFLVFCLVWIALYLLAFALARIQ